MKYFNLFVTPILLVSMVHSVISIHCFNCSSYENEECATLQANDTTSPFYVNCTDPREIFCRKTIITIIDSDRYVRVTRSCGYEMFKDASDNCYETDDEFKFERSCQCFQDGCNASTRLGQSLTTLAGALVLVWMHLNN